MLTVRSFTAMSALVGSAFTQSTSVTSLMLYGFEGDNIVASVISAAPQSTQYFVTCAAGTDAVDCGFGPGVTFTEGPSTLGLHLTETGTLTIDLDCQLASQSATCVETITGPSANYPGVTSAILSSSDLSEGLVTVTITAGLDLLSNAASATTTTSSSTSASGTTTEASTGASVTETSATKTASSTASGTATESSTATGAAHRSSQNVMAAGLVGLCGMALLV